MIGHEVVTAHERGWSMMKNGELLAAAQAERFDVLVTTDTNLQYQQNLRSRTVAFVVLSTTSWPRIQKSVDLIVNVVAASTPGSFNEVSIP